MYCLDIQTDENKNCIKKRGKGVKQSALKSCTFEDYQKCLISHQTKYLKSKSFRSLGQQMYTIQTNRMSFNPLNVSRYYIDQYTSTPHSYKGLKPASHFVVDLPEDEN